jgi:hypothetical protein
MTEHDDRDPPVVKPAQARSGRRGMPVLIVLVAALILLMIFWLPVEWYGESAESDDVAVEEETMPRSGSEEESETMPAPN